MKPIKKRNKKEIGIEFPFRLSREIVEQAFRPGTIQPAPQRLPRPPVYVNERLERIYPIDRTKIPKIADALRDIYTQFRARKIIVKILVDEDSFIILNARRTN